MNQFWSKKPFLDYFRSVYETFQITTSYISDLYSSVYFRISTFSFRESSCHSIFSPHGYMATINIDEVDGPVQFHLQTVVREESLEEGETLTDVAVYQSNLYVGTSLGNVLHYFRFDDSPVYILISRISVSSNQKPVNKILVLELVERALILCGSVASVYTLPELSPCKLGKLKDIRTIESLSYKEGLQNSSNASQKAFVVGYNKVRIIQIGRDLIKLVKDVNYNDAIDGLSCSAKSATAYSNLVVVSNKSNYDLIDLKETRMISLFKYKSTDDSSIAPHCASFTSESGREEFLLTIHADSSTSIAMFVNSDGDVTRGTLSWVDLGYPQSIATQWPYVFTVMDNSELVVSSLQSIEHKAQKKLEGLRLIQLARSVECKDNISSSFLTTVDVSTGETTHCELSTHSKVLAVTSNELLIIHKTDQLSLLATQFQDLMKQAELNFSDLESLSEPVREHSKAVSGSSELFCIHLLSLIYIILKDHEKSIEILLKTKDDTLLIDPQFMTYTYKAKSDEGYKIYQTLKEVIDGIDLNSLDEQIFKDYLLQTHRYYLALDLAKLTESAKKKCCFIREMIYTVVFTRSDEAIKFAKGADTTGWTQFKKANSKIMEFVRQGTNYWARIEFLKLLGNQEQDVLVKQEYAVEICKYSMMVLKGEIVDPAFKEEDRGALLDTFLELLQTSFYDEKLYAKNLLQFLDIDMNKGVSFLRSQKGGKFKATHKHILEEISSKYDDKKDEIYQLKAEFAEASLRDDIADISNLEDLSTLSETLVEIVSMLSSRSSDAEIMNFQILQQTYQIENNLETLDWPKLTWLDYLSANMRRSECPEYIELYLKAAELLIVEFHWLQNHEEKEKVLSLLRAEQYEYLRWIISGTEMITRLLSVGDFSNAEFYAKYGRLPLQSHPYYFEDFKERATENSNDSNSIKAGLTSILDHYLKFVLDKNGNYSIIQMFLQRYGEPYFDAYDIIRRLPELFPVSYLQEYLQQELLRRVVISRHVTSTKALARFEVKSTSALIQSLDNGG